MAVHLLVPRSRRAWDGTLVWRSPGPLCGANVKKRASMTLELENVSCVACRNATQQLDRQPSSLEPPRLPRPPKTKPRKIWCFYHKHQWHAAHDGRHSVGKTAPLCQTVWASIAGPGNQFFRIVLEVLPEMRFEWRIPSCASCRRYVARRLKGQLPSSPRYVRMNRTRAARDQQGAHDDFAGIERKK